MHRIHDSLFIGDLSTCRPGSEQLAVIHACKYPCHQRAVEYTGTLPRPHPHYLALVRPYDLYLNLIDPPIPLFQLESFHCFLDFASQHAARPLLIHCNQGESRAPSLALLLLALRQRCIPDASYAEARAAFASIYPAYRPGAGIQQFLTQHWRELEATALLSR